MRNVGEGGIGKLAQARKATAGWKERNIKVPCCECGYIGYFSAGSAAHVGYKAGYATTVGTSSWRCRECKKRDQDEVNQAIINVAKRKGLI